MNIITLRVGMSLAEAERELLVATLKMHSWDKAKTARTLGVSLKTIYNLTNKYEIRPPVHVLGATAEYPAWASR